MKKHINIPIFIPHKGCPNDCVFCNQRKISGTLCFDITKVKYEIEKALETVNKDDSTVQIAFFGGSFTGIPREEMLFLLGIAKEYIDKGLVSSVRLSTRPDYINEEILNILKSYKVKSIELGIQSLSDKVLLASGRGHDAACAVNACKLIKSYGFELIGQMMTALPCAAKEDEVFTAKALCKLGVDGARIYPTMVFAKTELEAMTERGEYIPPKLDELTDRTEAAFSVFCDNNIPVIRIGLQASDGLGDADGITYGSYESAMGEMVISRYYLNKIKALLKEKTEKLTVYCAVGEASKISGHKKENKQKLYQEFGIKQLKIIESKDITPYDIRIE
ncbi:MAG: radical SAM protein [Clostridia bacterium]|nr:radical SAM protein [Clostridia bacterium]